MADGKKIVEQKRAPSRGRMIGKGVKRGVKSLVGGLQGTMSER